MSSMNNEYIEQKKMLKKLALGTISIILIGIICIILGVYFHNSHLYIGFSLIDGVLLMFLLLIGMERLEIYQKSN